jgi:hypothetical protein
MVIVQWTSTEQMVKAFNALRSKHRGHEAVLFAFDLIGHDGNDLRDLPAVPQFEILVCRILCAKLLLAQKQLEDFLMADARCSCGAVTLSLPEEPSKLVVACHCLDCQRRTGAPFGVGAYYPADVVTISGTSKEFTHAAASGGKIHNYFCPQCGSTVYWKLSNLPALIAVAVGAMAEPKYPAPVISVFEQSKHDWVQIDGAVEHFRQSSRPKKSN